MNWKLYIVTLLFVAGLAGLFGYKIHKPERIIIDNTKPPKVDTLVVKIPMPVTETLPAKHDTTYVDRFIIQTDTVYIQDFAPIAYTETDLIEDSTKYGHLRVKYFYPPWDVFDIDFQPVPLPTIQITKYVEKPNSWYNSKILWLALGAVGGVFITK